MTDIIAHRGSSRECLENSYDAFARALAESADGIELDVHASKDGKIFVHHDATVTDSTVDGQSKLNIAQSSTETLEGLRLKNGEPLPTLDGVLDLVGSQATVYVEIKGFGIEKAVAECLSRHPNVRTAVHSFDHRMPSEVRRLRPDTRTGVLSASYVLDLGCMLDPAQAEDLWQHAELIDQLLVGQAHAMGVRVIAWTENSADRAAQLIKMGVNAICTDTPGLLRESLARLSNG